MTIQAGHGTGWRMPANQAIAITAADRIAPAATSRSRGPAFRIARPLGDRNRSRSVIRRRPPWLHAACSGDLGQASSGSGAQAGRRFSVKARKPSCASSLVRCRAMTRAVCHLDDPWPRPRISRTIALAARVAVGPGSQQVRDRRVDGSVERLLAFDDLVDQPDPGRPSCVEAAAAREERPGVGLADLGDDERADDRWQDPQPRLGEAEARPGLGDDHVGNGQQPHPATQRRAVDAGDDRHRAGVDGLEHVGHRHRVLFVALGVQRHRGAHPVEVGAGAEGRPVAGQDHRSKLRRRLAGERRERGPEIADEGRVEGVVDVRAGQRHAGDDIARPGTHEPQGGARRPAHTRIPGLPRAFM